MAGTKLEKQHLCRVFLKQHFPLIPAGFIDSAPTGYALCFRVSACVFGVHLQRKIDSQMIWHFTYILVAKTYIS